MFILGNTAGNTLSVPTILPQSISAMSNMSQHATCKWSGFVGFRTLWERVGGRLPSQNLRLYKRQGIAHQKRLVAERNLRQLQLDLSAPVCSAPVSGYSYQCLLRFAAARAELDPLCVSTNSTAHILGVSSVSSPQTFTADLIHYQCTGTHHLQPIYSKFDAKAAAHRACATANVTPTSSSDLSHQQLVLKHLHEDNCLQIDCRPEGAVVD